MKNILVIILFSVILDPVLTNAQVTQEWVATYNGTGSGAYYAKKNAVDKFGNLIVCGKSDNASIDYMVLKYNSSGALLWSQIYDGTANSSDQLADMILDDSGNVYVTGSSNEGAANGYFNWLTIKYSPDGVMRWKKSLDWTMHKEDVPYSITLDKNGNVYVAGYGWAPGGLQNFDMILAKYNNEGIEQWVRAYDSNPPGHADWGYSVVCDDSACSYISGYSYSSNVITIKYDESGNQVWLREYPRLNAEYPIPLFSEIDQHGNVIVNGYYQVAGQSNFVTLKYDRSGIQLWDRVFDSPVGTIDFVYDICIDDSSNVYIAGSTQGQATFHDILLIKYSQYGDTIWIRTYDDGIGEADIAYSLYVDHNQNVYVTGKTYTLNKNDDFITLKFNSNGDIIWNKKYSLPNTNISYSIALDMYDNVFISGYTDLSLSESMAVSIKYSQLTGMEINNNQTAEEYYIKNYPNPFNPKTEIRYNLGTAGSVSLKVFDTNGKTVKDIINGKQNSGQHTVEFDGNELPSGVYFCALIVNGVNIQITKMVLLK